MAIPFIDLCSGIGGFHSGLVNLGGMYAPFDLAMESEGLQDG